MIKLKFQVVMTANVAVDCYSGENCDQQRKFFDMYCEGDMDGGEAISEQIIINLADLPVGAVVTVVTVEYPRCPKCDEARRDSLEPDNGAWKIVGHPDKCDCGFDWVEWAEGE